ncbi:MAG: carbohydrate porin [Symploca sp. SIO2G7]|nr:carbohydrate porin [Symploca sp. SIO2G7]
MKSINQKPSNTNKQTNIALRPSPKLTYLLSISSISKGALSLFSVAAILGTQPAQANLLEQSSSFPDQTVEEEPTSQTSYLASEENFPYEAHQYILDKKSFQATERNFFRTRKLCEQTITDICWERHTADSLNLLVMDEYVELTANASDNQPPETVIVPSYLSLAPLSSVNSLNQVQRTQFTQATELKQAQQVFFQPQPKTVATVNPGFGVYLLSASSANLTLEQSNLQAQLPAIDASTLAQLASTTAPITVAHMLDSVEDNAPFSLTQVDRERRAEGAGALATTGAAALTGIQPAVAQGVGEDEPEPDSISQNSATYDPLSPSLDVQGVFLNQVDSSARLRLRGFYPVSPNALFGAIVDLATGDDFAGTEDSGLNLSELYFTGNLPDYPNLRLVVGLMDLTSYFDRNSFAKDNTTHFFNNVFQTNPALATAGIGSRLGVLLNWNITDNIEAKGAAFSSNRDLGDFALDAFAGEIGFRAGNGIIRATYSTDQDTGRDGIVGFPTNQAPLFFERGTQNGDREDAFGINGEYFIPEINLGLFARYGWHENSELDRGADTYSLGLNLLDLFMKEDRLGFGYGRELSHEDGRRIRGDKVPDVWELFYDARISPNFRAGVTLQARDEFSDVILGFRVRTDWQIFP